MACSLVISILAISCSKKDEAEGDGGSSDKDGPGSDDGPGVTTDGDTKDAGPGDGTPALDGPPLPTCPYHTADGSISYGEYCPTGIGCDEAAGLSCQYIGLLGTFICTSLCDTDGDDCGNFGADACCATPVGKQKNGPFCVPAQCKVCD